ncbi:MULTISPECIES: alpha/beta hydrolase family protein [unclassified Saccharothrix]|uniref:alpha/beta hydrolase family protein n=1 Tax=unclassified Saccharothrix TaxID=2593673 RepID=UPI00307CE5B3
MRAITIATAVALAATALPAFAHADPTPTPADPRPTSAGPVLTLPAPTGPLPVGSTSLHLKDLTRADPWVPTERRELMVTLFYPAFPTAGPRTQYLTPEESAAMLADSGLAHLPSDFLAHTRTHSAAGARPFPRPHGLPLVVLSPGYTKPRATLTALAEDLAAHGYAVAVIGHTHENYGTSFPDGRFAGCASCEVDHLPEFWEKLAHGRAADVSFVLDELLKRPGLVDPTRIAMGGHSAGGGSTITAMLADPRIRAGFDLDGRVYTPVPDTGFTRPFLFMGKYPADFPFPRCTPWQDDFGRLDGWKRWLSVTGAQHASFTDLGPFADQLGVDIGATITGERAQAITRDYVGAFLDTHLRAKRRPLLDQPSPRYPEVAFCG